MALEKILFVPDTHVPYHDKKAFNLVVKVGQEFKPDHTIILGDFIDCYTISAHSKNPKRALGLQDEVDDSVKELYRLKALGAKNNVFIAGNHEHRLERYISDKAPDLFPFVSIPEILKLKPNGWTYVPYRSNYQIGKLNITHDTGHAGRYANFRSLDTYQHNIVTGHTHRLGYFVEGNSRGERHLSTSFGWLGDINYVDYMLRIKVVRDWQHGFGIGYLDTNTKVVYVTPVPIINYKCLVNGKLYTS